MNTKMKGLLKGLRYISQIFDEEKEAEIQIGLPTDVKHVAHIGWDGGQSSATENPSWMKEFKGEAGVQSDSLANLEIKDKGADIGKSSRRQSSSSDNPDKNRHSRRTRSKDTSDIVVKSKDAGGDLPKKSSRRKQSKDCGENGSSRSKRSSKRQNAHESDQDPDSSIRSFYSDFGDGSTRSSRRGGSTSDY